MAFFKVLLFKLPSNSLHLSFNAGQFLSEVERHEDAADHYVKAAQLAPSEYEIIFNAANTLRQAGRNKQAEEYYRLAVNLRPQVGVATVLDPGCVIQTLVLIFPYIIFHV